MTFGLDPLKASLGPHAREKAVQVALAQTEVSIARGVKGVQEVLSRYHRLATLGQLIDVFLHDGRQPLASIVNQATLGLEALSGPADPLKKLANVESRLQKISNQAETLKVLFRRIEPFGGRKRGRPKQIYLESVIHNVFDLFATDVADLKVRVALPEPKTLVRVDESEFGEIVVNLLQNSLYWLKSVPEKARKIVVKTDRPSSERVEMVFSDSGPGVSGEIRESIFDPYFSTKPEGVGLGLTIAGEIASDYYDGSLALLDSGPLPGATFRLTLRRRI